MLEVFLGQKIDGEEGQRQTHPREKKLPHSRGMWSPDATGGQLLLGGEAESEQNKYHQCTHQFWAMSAGESCPLKKRLAVLIPFNADWLLRLNFQATSCRKDPKLWFVSILCSQQHTKPGRFQSPCTELPEMSNQGSLMAEFLHIYLQCKKVLCFVKLVFLLCLK